MPLHDDTLNFLEKRNEFRNQLAAALRGESTDEEQAEDDETQVEDCPEDNPEAAAAAAEQEAEDEQQKALDFVIGPPDPNKAALGPAAAQEEECDVEPREGTPCNEPGDGCNLFRRLDKITPLECLRDPKGWPNSDALYERLKEATLNPEDPDNFGRAQIQLMRQVNVMESYRKMLLHKKQRLCHYVAAWCECMKNEPQSQEELEELMLHQPIGRTVTS